MSADATKQDKVAVDYLLRALRENPIYVPALEALAQLDFSSASPDTRQVLERLIKLRPDEPVAHAMLAHVAFDHQDCQTVIQESEKAMQIVSQDGPALSAYGTCLGVQGQIVQAISILRRSLERDPANVQARYNLALLLTEHQRLSEAETVLQPALNFEVVDSNALTLAAEIQDKLGHGQVAVDLLRRNIAQRPTDESAYIQLAALCYKYSPRLGIQAIDFGLTQLTTSPELYLVRGILYGELGDLNNSTADLEHAQALDADHAAVSMAKGLAQQQGNNVRGAEPEFRAAINRQPNDPLPHLLLASVLAQSVSKTNQPRSQEAILEAELAVRLSPEWLDARILLARIYLVAGRPKEAASEAEKATSLDPHNKQALFQLVMSKRKLGETSALPELVKRLSEAGYQDKVGTYKPPPAY